MQTWYIYYDSSGRIYSITNEKKVEGNYIESSEENVHDFIIGKKKFDNFLVKCSAENIQYIQEKSFLDSLRFKNLEKLTSNFLESIDFNEYKVKVYEHMPNNFNFLITSKIVNDKNSLTKFLDKNVLIKVVKNDQNN